MPRNSEVAIFNKYETTICITRKYLIQYPNVVEDNKKHNHIKLSMKKLCRVNQIMYLPFIINFNISTVFGDHNR